MVCDVRVALVEDGVVNILIGTNGLVRKHHKTNNLENEYRGNPKEPAARIVEMGLGSF